MHSLFIHSSFIPIKTLFCLQRIISEPFPSCQTPTIPSIWLVFVIIILSSFASLYKIAIYKEHRRFVVMYYHTINTLTLYSPVHFTGFCSGNSHFPDHPNLLVVLLLVTTAWCRGQGRWLPEQERVGEALDNSPDEQNETRQLLLS